ncbi:thioesterase domain-containing protein [Escherichia coli]|nr:thioesterase domain-containing protein [Escherichia coli]
MAFETRRPLEQRGLRHKDWIISGCHAPHLHSERQLSHRDDADFIAELIDIGGCSPELRENQELMSLFLPLLRADFYATESYHHDSPDVSSAAAHACAVIVRQPRSRSLRQQVDARRQWLSHVTGPVVIDGDHFYPIQQARSFLRRLSAIFPTHFLQ